MNRKIENPVFKDTATFIKTAAETNGAVSELEITLMPGGGNPLHYHITYTETFTALKGELCIELKNRQKIVLKPGECYVVKKREVHRFLNAGNQEITFKVEFHPGHEGAENTLRILYGLATDGLCNNKGVPKNFTDLAICGIMSDISLPGLLAFTTPLLKLIAGRAKRNGIKQQLLNKYCK